MLNRLLRVFAPPIFADEEKTRTAQILNAFIWSAIGILSIFIVARAVVWSENGYIPLLVLLGVVTFLAAGQIMLRRGHARGTSIFLVGALWAAMTYQAFEADGLRDAAIFAYMVVVIFSSLLLGWKAAVMLSGMNLAVIWYFAIVEERGERILHVDSPFNYARDLSIIFVLVGILIYLLVSNWTRTLKSSRLELEQRLLAEEKLQRQADYLTAINEISLGSLKRLELRPLLTSILMRACRLIDTENGLIELVLPDGSALRQEVGQGGFEKYNGALTLQNEGMVGSVWEGGKTMIVEDYPNWEKRLPEGIEAGYTTVMGVPLKVSDTVIGVLVVAYTETGRNFSQEKINLLERFAALVSLAIDNARLYEMAQKELQERRNTESALRLSEERMRAILAAIPDMIFEISSNGTLLDFIASAELTPIIPPSEFIGKNVTGMFPPAIAEQTLFSVKRAIETGQLHAFEYGLPPGEETQFFEARVSAMTSASAVVMVRDISQRKWVESEREKLINELEGKNSELERFTYTVSHDLKSPLITIKGFLGFLERDAASGNQVRLKADIQRIASATDKMQILLNELLDLTRIGRLVNPSQIINLGEIAHEAVELVHGRIQSRGVHVSIQRDLPSVFGDRRRLVEVLQNLVDNGVKFMGDQPSPRIEIGFGGYENEMPIFYVRDNGMGIEIAHHDRIFGLFNKLDVESDGTGIGLALVKRIIEVHGGRIWVESEPARGASFLFTLPTKPVS
jgi:signal transduction histidine kinase